MSGGEPGVAVGSILFTDLVGFTEFTDTNGDHAAVEVLDRQTAIVDAELGHHGRVVKELGDGLLLWFAEPSAGVDAARRVQTAVAAERERGRFPLAVRMGIHAGEVLERGDDVIGQTVNVASRVADLAAPGELLATEEVVRAVSAGTHRFRPVGPTRIKGVGDPIWLHRLVC